MIISNETAAKVVAANNAVVAATAAAVAAEKAVMAEAATAAAVYKEWVTTPTAAGWAAYEAAYASKTSAEVDVQDAWDEVERLRNECRRVMDAGWKEVLTLN